MNQSSKAIFVVLLLAALGGLLAYAFISGAFGSRGEVVSERLDGNKSLTTEQDFRDKITELRMQREKVNRGIKRLEMLKAETLQHLKDKGINSSADITDDVDVRYALRNLKGWKTEIDKLKEDVGNYDEAIKSIDVMLDEIERKRIDEDVALSEDEYIELRKIVKDLNERLGMDKQDVLEEEELSQLLDEELEKAASDDSEE